MYDYKTFKSAFMGFNKDEVIAYMQKKDDENEKVLADLKAEIRQRDKVIAELNNRLVAKDEKYEALERNVQDKYQPYIDNYSLIGSLVYDAQVRAKEIEEKARTEADSKKEASERDYQAIVTDAENIRSKARSQAEAYLAGKTAEADTYINKARSEADRYTAETRGDADAYARKTRNEADGYAEQKKSEADDLMAGCRREGERILTDAEGNRDKLLADARNEVNKLVSTAHDEHDRIIAQAEDIAAKKKAYVDAEIAASIGTARKKYTAIRTEMESIVELINQVQKRFMNSYRDIHMLSSELPEELQGFTDDEDEFGYEEDYPETGLLTASEADGDAPRGKREVPTEGAD